MINKIIDIASKRVLLKNKDLLDKHKGEECYLIGNGDSIKYYNLDSFSDRISIGCNGLNVHRDIDLLDMRYYVSTHPFLYCRYWTGEDKIFHFKKNPFFDFLNKLSDNYLTFVHISNYFCINDKRKFRFTHNLSRKKLSISNASFDLSKSSELSESALDMMLGLAIYMGFKRVFLVGCDYFSTPYENGHFYEEREVRAGKNTFIYQDLINLVKGKIEIVVIGKNDYSSEIEFITYEKHTGHKELYKDANKIVLRENIEMWRNAWK
jgi:hypothetical protein